MVVFNQAGDLESAFLRRIHPYHANSAFEISFQEFSIGVVSWDFHGAIQNLADEEGRRGRKRESATAEIARKALHCFAAMLTK
jgi:hypothetical protein